MAAQKELRYDGQTVVVTGAGGGLGKAYATFFASRGASVVVNDLGSSMNGSGSASKAADVVVEEIKSAGGKAIANYDSVENGEAIINAAVKAFGTVHILINNAGILRDKSFKNMKDEDWDAVIAVHVRGAYKCSKAAWSHMKKQKYGRIINTASLSGLHGNFGQANYSAAKMGLISFGKTLAIEGAKNNIHSNIIVPVAASRMTETIMSPAELEGFHPGKVVPLVAVLCHASSKENGSVFEAAGNVFSKLRWQRAKGASLKPDPENLTPGAILEKWDEVNNFEPAEYPHMPPDFIKILEASKKLPSSKSSKAVDFKGKVAVVTGAGGGLGRAYALAFGKYGAKVVLVDLADPEAVAQEIRAAGGTAYSVRGSVSKDATSIVDKVVTAYGRIDVLINNAGILRDKAFGNMTDDQWHAVLDVHLTGTYKMTKAAWPHMLKQKFGRIVNTTSFTGLYGNFGQANYAAAKGAILGFSFAMAKEGAKNNIKVSTVAPHAGTNMTRTIMPEEQVQAFKPDYVASLVLALCSDPGPASGGVYECGSGWQGRLRWQRGGGYSWSAGQKVTPEDILVKWGEINSFDNADYPSTPDEGMKKIMANLMKKQSGQVDYLRNIEEAKKATGKGTPFSWTEKDVILYNLGLGAKRTELPFVYENDDNFQVLPTFGVVPPFGVATPWNRSDIMPKFSNERLLHAEQYLEIRKFPIPVNAETVSVPKLIEVLDKGKAAIAVHGTVTKDKNTGEEIFYNQETVFVRGSGGFGGETKSKVASSPAGTTFTAPKRQPDVVETEQTTEEQAALYRLSGDRNPLHIDPVFSAAGGFKDPILHGLCSMGIAGKAVLKHFGMFKNIKVRFVGTVLPGQTLKTEMWKEGKFVIFQTTVVETGKLCIGGAGAELRDESVKASL